MRPWLPIFNLCCFAVLQLPGATQVSLGPSSQPDSPSHDNAPPVLEPENEEEQAAGVSVESGVVGSSRSGGAGAGRGNRKRKSPQNEEMLTFIAERMQASDRMEKRLDEALRGGNDHKQAFGHWMMTEMVQLPDELWTHFRAEAFNLLTSYQDRARAGPGPQLHHEPPYFQPQQQYNMGHGQWPSTGHPPPLTHLQSQQYLPPQPPRRHQTPPPPPPYQQQQGHTAGLTPLMQGQGGGLNISGLSDLVNWPAGTAHLVNPRTSSGEQVLSTPPTARAASTPATSARLRPAPDTDEEVDVQS